MWLIMKAAVCAERARSAVNRGPGATMAIGRARGEMSVQSRGSEGKYWVGGTLSVEVEVEVSRHAYELHLALPQVNPEFHGLLHVVHDFRPLSIGPRLARSVKAYLE